MSEDKVEKARKRAMELFNGKRANCAEAVFGAIYELVDTELPPEVSSLLTPLGGGFAASGENCGAMLAGVIAFVTPPSWGNALMATGFGGFNILCGALIALRHGG